MASVEPLLIICAEPKIYKPKPRRINKKINFLQYNKKTNIYNRNINHRASRINNYEQNKNKNKNNLSGNKNEKLSFNLDLISLEEIENDFKEFKSKSEEIEVQRELINLMKRTNDESCINDNYINFQKIKRPQNPFSKNIK